MAFYRGGEATTYDFGFGDVNSSRWDAFKTSVEEGVSGGLIGITNRQNEDYSAKYGVPPPMPGMFPTPADQVQYQLDNYTPPKILTKEEAEQKATAAGVKIIAPEKGISKDYLDLLISRKQEQNARDLAVTRTPGGVVSGTVNLLGSLAGSLADPTNVALAFVPVVGEARYAAMLERAGASAIARTGVRAGVGAVEGAAGMAMLEPFVALDKISNQEDYGIGTAAADIGFGAVFGAAMHTGIHAIGRASEMLKERFGGEKSPAIEAADRVSPDINEAAVRAKIAADAVGADINVDPIVKLDPRAEVRLTAAQLEERAQAAEDYARRLLAENYESAKANPESAYKDAVREGERQWDAANQAKVDANTPVQGDMEAVKRSVQESNSGATDRLADHKAADDAAAKLPEAEKSAELETVKADTDEIVRQVKEIEAMRGVEFAEMKAAEDAANRLQVLAKATKAAAVCGVKF